MKVPISNMTFAESQFNGEGGSWKAQTLYDLLKQRISYNGYALWCVDLSTDAFECGSLKDFIFQCKRVMIPLLIILSYLMIKVK